MSTEKIQRVMRRKEKNAAPTILVRVHSGNLPTSYFMGRTTHLFEIGTHSGGYQQCHRNFPIICPLCQPTALCIGDVLMDRALSCGSSTIVNIIFLT